MEVGDIIGGSANVLQAIVNPIMQHVQNKHNEKMVGMQNAAAAAEAEKAYERSKPTTQVANMRQVGMSQAGAVNALNGGGSYTPAPVNASQGEAPQLDVSGLTNVLMANAQLKQQEKLAKMNLAAQKEESAANRENAKDIAQIQAEASKYGADKNYDIAIKRYNLDKSIADQLTPKQVAQLDSIVAKNKAETNLTNTQTSDLAYRIAEYQSKEYKSVRDAQNLVNGLEADFNYKITQKSFSDYLNENYTYNSETGEYEPKEWISNANEVQQSARAVWNTIFEIIPINLLLEALGGTVENVRALKLLSKVK